MWVTGNLPTYPKRDETQNSPNSSQEEKRGKCAKPMAGVEPAYRPKRGTQSEAERF